MNDNSVTAGANGENPFHVTYAGGTATFTVDFPGVFIAFVPKEASKLPAATTSIGMSNSFDLGSSIAINFRINKTNLANFEEVYALIDHDAYTLNESICHLVLFAFIVARSFSSSALTSVTQSLKKIS